MVGNRLLPKVEKFSTVSNCPGELRAELNQKALNSPIKAHLYSTFMCSYIRPFVSATAPQTYLYLYPPGGTDESSYSHQ